MTYRERYALTAADPASAATVHEQLCPDMHSPVLNGFICPYPDSLIDENACKQCWDRQIPDWQKE